MSSASRRASRGPTGTLKNFASAASCSCAGSRFPFVDLAEQSQIHFRRRCDLPSPFSRRLRVHSIPSRVIYARQQPVQYRNSKGPFSRVGTVPPDRRVVNDARRRPKRGLFGPCIDREAPGSGGAFGLLDECRPKETVAQGVEPGGSGSRAGIRPFGRSKYRPGDRGGVWAGKPRCVRSPRSRGMFDGGDDLAGAPYVSRSRRPPAPRRGPRS
jgi:hypothetical protein